MPMYDLIEYSNSYSKTSGILLQYFSDEPALADNSGITDFNEDNVTNLFKIKDKITGKTGNSGTKGVEGMLPLKYLSNFWRTFEMPLINGEINLDLKWSKYCVIVATNVVAQATTFSTTDTKLYVPVVTLSTQENAKLLEQLKSGIKGTINWNEHQSKVSTERQNQRLDYLIDPSFQGVNRLFVLSFENGAQRMSYKRYYLPTIEIQNFNVMIDGQNFFDQIVRNSLITYDNIQKIATDQGDEYTTGFLVDYNYFNKHYKMIAIDLSKLQALDAGAKAIQQFNFTGNLDLQAILFFIIEEAKETVLHFSHGTVKVFFFVFFALI